MLHFSGYLRQACFREWNVERYARKSVRRDTLITSYHHLSVGYLQTDSVGTASTSSSENRSTSGKTNFCPLILIYELEHAFSPPFLTWFVAFSCKSMSLRYLIYLQIVRPLKCIIEHWRVLMKLMIYTSCISVLNIKDFIQAIVRN